MLGVFLHISPLDKSGEKRYNYSVEVTSQSGFFMLPKANNGRLNNEPPEGLRGLFVL